MAKALILRGRESIVSSKDGETSGGTIRNQDVNIIRDIDVPKVVLTVVTDVYNIMKAMDKIRNIMAKIDMSNADAGVLLTLNNGILYENTVLVERDEVNVQNGIEGIIHVSMNPVNVVGHMDEDVNVEKVQVLTSWNVHGSIEKTFVNFWSELSQVEGRVSEGPLWWKVAWYGDGSVLIVVLRWFRHVFGQNVLMDVKICGFGVYI